VADEHLFRRLFVSGLSLSQESLLKRNIVFALCLASSLLGFSKALAAQQTPPSSTEQTPPPAAQQTTPSSRTEASPSPEQVSDAEIQLMREDIRSERKKVVAANLPLTETEATRFWPVYDRYVAETVKINDKRYALIKEYAQSRDTMTDAQANDYIKRWVALDGDYTQLRLKFVPEFEKVISPKKTAMFFQIDSRIGLMIELQLASQVPLVKP
jgi:hypothetical protein